MNKKEFDFTPEQYKALEKYGVDLVQQVKAGKQDPIIGRDEEIRDVIQDEIHLLEHHSNVVYFDEPDDGVFSFDDLDEGPGTATGDFDMELNPPSERHPWEPDDGVYNFGDIDLMDMTAKGNYDFGDLEEGVSPDSEINFFRVDPLVEITDDDRATLLKRLMEGKVIYGSV